MNQQIKNPFLQNCVSFLLSKAEYIFIHYKLFTLQKMNEAYFKAVNLTKDNKLDVEAAHKYVDELVKMEDWKPVLKTVATKCLDILSKQKDEIESEFEKAPFNIKKGECNVFYMAFGWCASMQMFDVSLNFRNACSITTWLKKLIFQNCPAKAWTAKPTCQKGKEWVKKCGNKMEVWMVFDDESSSSEEKH